MARSAGVASIMSPIWLCCLTTRMRSKRCARNSSTPMRRARRKPPTNRISPRLAERSSVFTRPTLSPLLFFGALADAGENVEIALIARSRNAFLLDRFFHPATGLVRVRARVVAAGTFDMADVREASDDLVLVGAGETEGLHAGCVGEKTVAKAEQLRVGGGVTAATGLFRHIIDDQVELGVELVEQRALAHAVFAREGIHAVSEPPG